MRWIVRELQARAWMTLWSEFEPDARLEAKLEMEGRALPRGAYRDRILDQYDR